MALASRSMAHISWSCLEKPCFVALFICFFSHCGPFITLYPAWFFLLLMPCFAVPLTRFPSHSLYDLIPSMRLDLNSHVWLRFLMERPRGEGGRCDGTDSSWCKGEICVAMWQPWVSHMLASPWRFKDAHHSSMTAVSVQVISFQHCSAHTHTHTHTHSHKFLAAPGQPTAVLQHAP